MSDKDANPTAAILSPLNIFQVCIRKRRSHIGHIYIARPVYNKKCYFSILICSSRWFLKRLAVWLHTSWTARNFSKHGFKYRKPSCWRQAIYIPFPCSTMVHNLKFKQKACKIRHCRIAEFSRVFFPPSLFHFAPIEFNQKQISTAVKLKVKYFLYQCGDKREEKYNHLCLENGERRGRNPYN